MGRLANVPELMSTEPLATYISRLAAVNGASTAREFRSHMGFRLDKRLDVERNLERLSEITGISCDTLASQNLRWEANWVLFGTHRLAGRTLHWSSPRYCARCLEHDMSSGKGRWDARPWIRLEWLPTHNEVCVEHRVKIFTSSTPYTNPARYDFANHLRNNRREFESALANCTPAEVRPYDSYFADRLREAHTPVELLDPLPYFVACRLSAIVGRMACYGDSVERRSVSPGIVDESRQVGFDILNDKPRFLGLLSELVAAYLQRKKSTKGYALYGELQDYLSTHLEIPELGPFIALVREHAMAALPIGPEDPFIGGGGTRRWHSLHSAMIETGVHSLTLRKILMERGLVAQADIKTSDNKILIKVADIDSAVADYRSSIDIQTIVDRLGVSLPTGQQIIRMGLLKPIYGTEKDMKAKFSKHAVDKLLADLMIDAEERDENEHTVSLDYAFRRAGCRISDIIVGMVNGKIAKRYLSKDTTKIGFERLLVDLREVKAEFAPGSPGLKRHEFARTLGLDHATGMAFFDSGFFEIGHSEGRVNRRAHDIVTQESFDAFFREHASLAELAKGWMQPSKLRTALTKASIFPVWACRERRIATFYRRSDVEAYRSGTY